MKYEPRIIGIEIIIIHANTHRYHKYSANFLSTLLAGGGGGCGGPHLPELAIQGLCTAMPQTSHL